MSLRATGVPGSVPTSVLLKHSILRDEDWVADGDPVVDAPSVKLRRQSSSFNAAVNFQALSGQQFSLNTLTADIQAGAHVVSEPGVNGTPRAGRDPWSALPSTKRNAGYAESLALELAESLDPAA